MINNQLKKISTASASYFLLALIVNQGIDFIGTLVHGNEKYTGGYDYDDIDPLEVNLFLAYSYCCVLREANFYDDNGELEVQLKKALCNYYEDCFLDGVAINPEQITKRFCEYQKELPFGKATSAYNYLVYRKQQQTLASWTELLAKDYYLDILYDGLNEIREIFGKTELYSPKWEEKIHIAYNHALKHDFQALKSLISRESNFVFAQELKHLNEDVMCLDFDRA